MTIITVTDIVHVTEADITDYVIKGDLMDSGALTEAVYYILLSLQTPLHGYGIMQNVHALSNGRLNLAAGTLYGAITTLLERGLIQSAGIEDTRKKEYCITQSGKKAVEQEIKRLTELLENGKKIMGDRV